MRGHDTLPWLTSAEGQQVLEQLAMLAYFTGDTLPAEPVVPYATCYTVDDAFPFNLKELNRRLRVLGVGRIIVMKRGSPMTPEQIRRQLKLQGNAERVVVLTQVQGEPYVVIYQPSGAGKETGTPS